VNRRYYYLGLTYAATVSSVYILHKQNVILFVSLVCLLILGLAISRFRYIKTTLGVMFLGPFTELICIRSGAWSYETHSILGVPIWLVPLWGIASLCFLSVGEFFNEISNNNRQIDHQ
jgi:hypothetical protein